jgi:ectoine hydroxylase-related dioxygenase (phytanoyl-CoA dioxygenase family)
MREAEGLRAEFERDGVVYVPHALSRRTLDLAERAWQWSIDHPGPGASHLPANGDGTFYQDLANPAALAAYTPLVREPEIAGLVTALLGQPRTWFMYEQIFLKENGFTRRTPWHQDTPYLPVDGSDLLVLWITFEPVPAANALEFVRGSHRGPLYDGSRFDPQDDTAPLYGTGELPRLPDIEADRPAWDIVSWDITPGDVLAFHPSILHGGAPTHVGLRRRTLSLRFFGESARVAQRPGMVAVENDPETTGPDVHPLTRMRRRSPGTPFRDAAFPEVVASIGSE